jgi:hypothetical protein
MQGNRNAGAVENRPTSRVPVQMEGIKWLALKTWR